MLKVDFYFLRRYANEEENISSFHLTEYFIELLDIEDLLAIKEAVAVT